ncbi:MAG TPA: hypothetical protein VER14_03315 [Phototrophicaceae bacterium]|nr:hypothetical protein [Phototrophicaceae bacterium]
MEKIIAAQEQFDGKKERSRKLNKTVNKNAADILSNIATKIPYTITTNNFEDVGMVTTTSKASEDRKTGGNLTFTNTAEQPTATFATVFQSECFECSTIMVSDY